MSTSNSISKNTWYCLATVKIVLTVILIYLCGLINAQSSGIFITLYLFLLVDLFVDLFAWVVRGSSPDDSFTGLLWCSCFACSIVGIVSTVFLVRGTEWTYDPFLYIGYVLLTLVPFTYSIWVLAIDLYSRKDSKCNAD